MATKPFLPLDKQIELLEGRGLTIANKEYAIKVLANVNYYRFSAYSLTLRTNDQFAVGTTFEDICRLYNFDLRLRNFVLNRNQFAGADGVHTFPKAWCTWLYG